MVKRILDVENDPIDVMTHRSRVVIDNIDLIREEIASSRELSVDQTRELIAHLQQAVEEIESE